MPLLTVERIRSATINDWLADVHYLHRRVIRSKLLGYAVFSDDKLVGGALWATPHFTRKRNLFGPGERLDKWEVLILARMYLKEDSGVQPSWFLSEMLGRSGLKNRTKRRGWRIQSDWLAVHPPRFPANPFVPRLLMSWSDTDLAPVSVCRYCKQSHHGHHSGTIYAANGWSAYDTTLNTRRRNHNIDFVTLRKSVDGKQCWILSLSPNPVLQAQYGANSDV